MSQSAKLINLIVLLSALSCIYKGNKVPTYFVHCIHKIQRTIVYIDQRTIDTFVAHTIYIHQVLLLMLQTFHVIYNVTCMFCVLFMLPINDATAFDLAMNVLIDLK